MEETDVTLLMNAFPYARDKTYPEVCNKNDKRSEKQRN